MLANKGFAESSKPHNAKKTVVNEQSLFKVNFMQATPSGTDFRLNNSGDFDGLEQQPVIQHSLA
jgi:hypothetical protein